MEELNKPQALARAVHICERDGIHISKSALLEIITEKGKDDRALKHFWSVRSLRRTKKGERNVFTIVDKGDFEDLLKAAISKRPLKIHGRIITEDDLIPPGGE